MQARGKVRGTEKTLAAIQKLAKRTSSASGSSSSGVGSQAEGRFDVAEGKNVGWRNLYRVPPTEDVTLEELEQLAMKRIAVLREFETLHACGGDAMQKQKRAQQILQGQGRDFYRNPILDNISHFILRLAYCKTQQLQEWFKAQEVAFLRARLDEYSNLDGFIAENELPGTKVTLDELEEVWPDIRQLLPDVDHARSHVGSFFRVHFTQVLDLVRNKRVVLRAGQAYVHKTNLCSVITKSFREELGRALAIAKRATPLVHEMESDRLFPFFNGLSERYANNSKWKSEIGISPEDIDELSKSHFPLCMKYTHEKLREQHHLRHGGRMQYGLFLKGIGLKLEDALRFWRTEFSKSMPVEKFDKAYAYNVRHNYGQEGKRTNYTPYGCHKIITSSHPGVGDHHGCPFRHFDPSNLRSYLMNKCNTKREFADEIIDLVQGQHYQIACKKYFQLTHPRAWEEINPINHPNQYFTDSLAYHKERMKGGVGGGSGSNPMDTADEDIILQEVQQQQQQQQHERDKDAAMPASSSSSSSPPSAQVSEPMEEDS